MEPISLTHFRNVGAEARAVQASNGEVGIGKIIAANSTNASVHVQFYDAASVNITLGTTRPMFIMSLPAQSYDSQDFAPPLRFVTRCSMYAATLPEGSAAPAAGVFVQLFVN